MLKYLLLGVVFSVFLTNFLLSQEEEVWFQPNKGQWDNQILYKVELQKGDFFIEKDKFTYALSNLGDVYHEAHQGKTIDKIQLHTIKSTFINSSWQGKIIKSDSSSFYKNYLLGDDATKWKSRIYSYKKLEFVDFYPGINLILEAFPTHLKYSFKVFPGTDASQIKIFHQGMSGLKVSENQVEIQSRFGSIFEKDLLVWNELENGDKKLIKSSFSSHQDTVFFHFPEDYDTTQLLIIDPSLTFSTFSGSTADNWGFTAAPDNAGNLYAGGIVFGTGYPISNGAYDASFNGGTGYFKIDMGISKFSPDGTNLIYSTYLGGNGNETPNSIITNNQGELYILGLTTSSNFPISPNAYQNVNNGGTSTNQIAIDFNGTDMTISKLSQDGSQLLAGTYLGGSKNDGLNVSTLNYNYGDVFRGEIILDKNGDVVVTSSTQSADFPIVNGSNTTLGGNQDAVVAKLSPDLSTLIWSTYLGGNDDDAGYSLQVSSSNNIYVTGGTKSNGLPFSGGYKSSFQGGSCDGFVVKLNGNTSAIMKGTYIGTGKYDQSFFVQLDGQERVYVFGQTDGNMEVSPGVYSNPNSGQFIQQYSSDLSTLNWSTIVGGGNGVVEISPTAFLVSNCNEIYFTGWGGQVNHSVQAAGSTSMGFPTTPDAYQSNTNGNNFYIGVLAENATALNYGTFMGGTASSFNHVDGGTSRFDKHGSIYHAVCAACGGNSSGFTTTPGVYSTTNNSSNCNMAAWKFDLGAIHAQMSTPDAFVCIPDSVHFTNTSQNGSLYFWDFGDGNTSTQFAPSHYYSSPGTYHVSLIVSDIKGCFEPDTSYLTIDVFNFDATVIQPSVKICPNEPFQLQASGGANYLWSPALYLDNPTLPNPTAVVDSTTEFTVIISDSCGADTLTVLLEVANISTETIDNLDICLGDTVQLWASGGIAYNWTTTASNSILGSSTNDTILIAPENDAYYFVEIAVENGCFTTDTIQVIVYQGIPEPVLADTAHVCKDNWVTINASGAPTITWSPNIEISNTLGTSATIKPSKSRWYYLDFTNPCGTVRDSIFIEIVNTHPQAGDNTTICPGDTVHLWASGGENYHWYPEEQVAAPTSPNTFGKPTEPMVYTVYITDEYGCLDSAKVHVDLFPEASVIASTDYYGFWDDKVHLSASGSTNTGAYIWSPPSYLSCFSCQHPISYSPASIVYTVLFTDANGCEATDEVKLVYDALIYVPNSFTPDMDEFNEVFKAVGGNVLDFEMKIFNRWGELIFETHDINEGWDGTYGGMKSQDGTYIWKIKYRNREDGGRQEMMGHVNLLR